MAKITGQKIVCIRQQTSREYKAEGWDRPAIVLELEDGTRLFASKDDEGNGPGAMFGTRRDGTGIYLQPGD